MDIDGVKSFFFWNSLTTSFSIFFLSNYNLSVHGFRIACCRIVFREFYDVVFLNVPTFFSYPLLI